MRNLSRYFFGLLVTVYVVTVVGMPVYLHYCGGQVEEVSYLVESNGCCGDEEPDNDCCRNEERVLLNNEDFTLKQFQASLTLAVLHIPYLAKYCEPQALTLQPVLDVSRQFSPWQHSLLADITVMRI